MENPLGARAPHAIRRLIKGGSYGSFPNAYRGDRPKYVANYYLGTRQDPAMRVRIGYVNSTTRSYTLPSIRESRALYSLRNRKPIRDTRAT
jgi:hypothetical protein